MIPTRDTRSRGREHVSRRRLARALIQDDALLALERLLRSRDVAMGDVLREVLVNLISFIIHRRPLVHQPLNFTEAHPQMKALSLSVLAYDWKLTIAEINQFVKLIGYHKEVATGRENNRRDAASEPFAVLCRGE